jgi:4-hydroxybenzoate polyprenyltransferase
VALMSALPIIEIYLFYKPLIVETEFIAYAVFAFLTSLLREIVKDKEDSAGDIETGIKTLANSISDKRLTMILSIINSALIVSLISFLFLLKMQTITGFLFYLLIMILPGILLFFQFFRSKTKASYTSISLYLKIYMFLGLIRLWI